MNNEIQTCSCGCFVFDAEAKKCVKCGAERVIMGEQKAKTAEEFETSTNSKVGTGHWFNTLMGRNLHIGEFLKEKSPDEETIRIWGQSLYDNCQELIAGRKFINTDESYEDQYKHLQNVHEVVMVACDAYKSRITELEAKVSDLESALTITKHSREFNKSLAEWYREAFKIVESLIESDAPGFALSKIRETLNQKEGK